MDDATTSSLASAALKHPSGTDSALLGKGAVLVWNDISAEGRERFYEWHDKEHIPERLAIPGFLRGRRYVNRGQSPEWLTLYEADDLDIVVSPAYLARLNAPTPGTTETLRYFQNTSRAVCRIVHSQGSSSGGHVLAIRLDVAGERSEALCDFLCSEVLPSISTLPSILACHLYRADQPGSFLNTAESSTRSFDVPSWVLLVEASTPEAAARARALIDAAELSRYGAKVRTDAAIYALEICRLAAPLSAA